MLTRKTNPTPPSGAARRLLTARVGRAVALAVLALAAIAPPAAPQRASTPIVGRWDITVRAPEGAYPSWLDVQLSGRTTLVGYFVGKTGSVRPISQVSWSADRVSFSLPIQFEKGTRDLSFEGRLEGDRLSGMTVTSEGQTYPWTAVRAPALRRTGEPRWGSWAELFNGRDLSGWKPRWPDRPNGWEVKDGLLRNAKPGNDLLTTTSYNDFQLEGEFRYPKGSNSGIYLRGRYEVQIEDNYGQEPESHKIGGVYGFLTPRVIAARPPEQWQTAAITLVGRRVSITLNSEPLLDRQEIPGITGGALDSSEGDPGPLLLQGDHGVIEYRSVRVRPAQ
jgi:hypothetical protein